VLGHAKFKSLSDKDSYSPGMLNADCIRRPGVEGLWDGFAKQKGGSAKHHEAPQRSAAKGTDLEHSREHVAGEQAARGVRTAILPSVSGAEVWVDFVVWRRQVKFRPSPKHVAGKEHSVLGFGILRITRGRLTLRAAQD